MTRFAIFVVYAFLLRAALQSRDSDIEIHLAPDGGSGEAAPAADPEGGAAAAKPEDGASAAELEGGAAAAEPEGGAAADEPEGGAGAAEPEGKEAAESPAEPEAEAGAAEAPEGEAAAEPGEGGAPDEPDSGGDAAAKPDEPAPVATPAPAPPCSFKKAGQGVLWGDKDVLKEALKGRAVGFYRKSLDRKVFRKILCTSMNISEGDSCCKLLKSFGNSVREAKKRASKTDDAGVKAWCQLNAKVKWAVESQGKGMGSGCKKHTDCAQAWWTKGMACAYSSSLFSFQKKCRLCPFSVARPGFCKSLKGAKKKKECESFVTCKDDDQCANPSYCAKKSSKNDTINGQQVKSFCKNKKGTKSKPKKAAGQVRPPNKKDTKSKQGTSKTDKKA